MSRVYVSILNSSIHVNSLNKLTKKRHKIRPKMVNRKGKIYFGRNRISG